MAYTLVHFHLRSDPKPAWDWKVIMPKVSGLEMAGTAVTEAEAKAAVEFVWTAWLELLGLQPIPGRA
ncbi:hypothetical protein [Methylobacterium sp. WL120]|uniref:hypothetical protein n=1 Tax=Methylobacterium sp. WL120 TaxID=2603887 RepID=UPI0011C962FA|nr:hypothetical protein [Methylobacterium sp. WL120]TXM65403.1 hypothetical protein FV229_15645 [Methylobacterium sp. WL120]